jgi:leucyl aminopeptidase
MLCWWPAAHPSWPMDRDSPPQAPTAVTMRGHQFPMAFLVVASGLRDHGAGSALPLPYCHLDLANSVVDGRGVETGAPIVPLFGHFLMGLDGD